VAKIPADVGSWLRELSTLLLERFLCFRRRGGRTGLDEDTNQVVHVGTNVKILREMLINFHLRKARRVEQV